MGVLPSAYLPTATGVFRDHPAPQPEPGGTTRLPGLGPAPPTPAQTEVPRSPPRWLCSCPCAHPPGTLRPSLENPLHPERTRDAKRRKREQRSSQHPEESSATDPMYASRQTAGRDHWLGARDSGSVLGRNAVLTYLPWKDEVVLHTHSAATLPVLIGEEPEKGPPTPEPETGSSSNMREQPHTERLGQQEPNPGVWPQSTLSLDTVLPQD
ncbi:hypothetical protein J1605_020519 [Eschrichtius robustus]|uniref:Uncharacterized protein n=1 Tax=Eschrichtius robustus TaxID=9764 RepID=A0AB34HL01_ESCRO|nr:hypothetical protein J1605_020519 [Eschrichtius robustus]